jgi:hypothetical protein
MRTLTATLLAAQRQASAAPYVKVQAVNMVGGAVRYDWSRLYTGSEDDYYHAATVPADGSLVRVRITPPADSRKLYRQRVSSPGPGSDFSQWTYTTQYNAVVAAAASLGAEVSVFWIKSNREIRRIKSTDYGATWGSPELIDYTPTTSVYGLAAAYKSNGDLAVFFADQTTLHVKKLTGGQWQARTAWDKTTGDLSGAACVYDGDWKLLVTGRDTSGNFKLWSLLYGDGGEIAAGGWSALKELASAPAGGAFEYKQPFLDKTDVYRCFFIESFTGGEAYSRPFHSVSVPGAGFAEGLWREPAPFNLSSAYGLAMAHHGDYAWLASPGGVWRAPLAVETLDLTADVVSIKEELGETAGELTIELKNDNGKYTAPGEGALDVLKPGCRLEFSPGCVTGNGNEYSAGQNFTLESYEYVTGGGRASLLLHSQDGWGALNAWQARQQSRWNKSADESSVKAILAFVLGRVGLKLEVKTESAVMTGFYPDFTLSPGDDGIAVIRKLLSFAPDLLFIEGDKACLVNPLASDSSTYSYGGAHRINEGSYRRGVMERNRMQMEGSDSGGGLILADSFSWYGIDAGFDRFLSREDKNLNTIDEAKDRGAAVLRKMEVGAEGGAITVPVNCGQQLYDVIDITDASAGLDEARKRVLGLTLVYRPQKGEYFQTIKIGGV